MIMLNNAVSDKGQSYLMIGSLCSVSGIDFNDKVMKRMVENRGQWNGYISSFVHHNFHGLDPVDMGSNTFSTNVEWGNYIITDESILCSLFGVAPYRNYTSIPLYTHTQTEEW